MNDLIGILNEIRPGEDFAGAENFFEQGLLDSLDLTTLVSALESRYGIFVDVDEMAADRFCNLAVIKTLLANKGVNL
jgi:acyl carrier protein